MISLLSSHHPFAMSQSNLSNDDSDIRNDLLLLELTQQLNDCESASPQEDTKRMKQFDLIL